MSCLSLLQSSTLLGVQGVVDDLGNRGRHPSRYHTLLRPMAPMDSASLPCFARRTGRRQPELLSHGDGKGEVGPMHRGFVKRVPLLFSATSVWGGDLAFFRQWFGSCSLREGVWDSFGSSSLNSADGEHRQREVDHLDFASHGPLLPCPAFAAGGPLGLGATKATRRECDRMFSPDSARVSGALSVCVCVCCSSSVGDDRRVDTH